MITCLFRRFQILFLFQIYFRVGVSMNVVGTIAPQVFKENHTNIYYFYPQNRILADLKKLHSQYEILKKTVINELFRINRSLARLLIKIWQITINYNLNLSSFLFNRSFWSLLYDWRGHFSHLTFYLVKTALWLIFYFSLFLSKKLMWFLFS